MVGRSRTPIPQSAQCYELAQWLRSLRQRSGLTYRQMAELTEGLRIADPACSAVTLSRADRGTFLPRRHVVEAYAQVCGATRREARLRWEQAARRSAQTPDGREVPSVPRIGRKLELVYHPAHLLEAMHQARLAAGQPSLREMEKKARDLGAGPLPRSTVADILSGFRMPSEELLVAYVRACGHQGRQVTLWRNAWARAFGAHAA
ncbi:helix-turn-helix transcriptional regulator [Streptomyces sp. NPDC002935]|uniref:helix-turn-helix domain-containing protein n=1 Tax=unclassified Streptomyces TaxID=2593676 RepID=UPI003330CF4F